MKSNILSKFITPLCAAAILSGCIGDALTPKPDPTAFYKLCAKDKIVSASELKDGVAATIMPVGLPPYMERTQIVTSDGTSRVSVSEFNRWIELPSESFGRVLLENISANAKDSNISIYPAVAFAKKSLWIRVSVFECIGQLGKDLSFKAQWQLVRSDTNEEVCSKDFVKSYPTQNNFDSYVEAINCACADMSKDIAAQIDEFSKKQK